ncbi:MAG: glycosyltransferase family 4 protein, partial [Acidobacteriota bacterium]|nr:glycosyltransferase family 4 protein [Acidobacteriota bacterium]
EHDITLDLMQQLLGQNEDWELRYQLPRWKRFEQEAWRTVDRVITMSDKDRGMIREGRAITLANGVDIERFRPSGVRPHRYRLLFIGSFAHLPNVLALEFFLREVWPLLQTLMVQPLTLHIIAGDGHRYYLNHYRDRVRLDLDKAGIEVEGFVSDVRPAYEKATVVIAPLLASAGTNIKIMEALAMGKAIVSTTAGINGLSLEKERDLLVEDEPKAMAEAILLLLRDEDKRAAIERQARQTAVEHFDWNVTAERQKQIYMDLCSERSQKSFI